MTFFLWAFVTASLAYWALKLGRSPSVAVAPVVRTTAQIDPAVVAQLLGSVPQAAVSAGGTAPAPSLASRFSLLGVVAARSRGGAALIAIDGKPARPFRVGSAVEDGLLLQAVEGRRALLGGSVQGPAQLTLELPAIRK